MKKFYEIAKQIDALISQKPSKESTEKLLRIIKSDRSYEHYFFEKIQIIDLFYPLRDEGYFSPNKAPSPEPAGEKGSFIIPQWNVLSYLEKVSQQVTITGNEKYSDELLGIIKNVTRYHIGEDRKLDNYRTWWYFVKILLNLPNDKIVKYLKGHNIKIGQDWIKEWITSKFDNMLPASDIATKLLPKFLTNKKDDIEIAEQIIEVITDVKEEFFEEEAIQKIGLFEKRKKAKTTVDSYWLFESFKKNSQKIGELCSERIIYNLAGKLESIFSREHEDNQILIEPGDNTYRISAKRIEKFHFKISIELLKKDEIESLKPEEKYFGISKVGSNVLHDFEISEIKGKEAFVQIIKEEISKTEKISFLNDYTEIDKKLQNLYDGLYSDYSYIWFKSLYSAPKIGLREANELLAFILRDISLVKCKSDVETGRNILNKFLSEEYQFPLFRRLVLYVVSFTWNEYKDLFWKFLEITPEAFSESNYEVELYKLLQSNVDRFIEDPEKKKINEFISKGPHYVPDEKQEHYIAYWKQKWYSAIQKDPYFIKLYEEQKAITAIEKIEPPSEKGLVEVHWGEGPSPLSKEDILRMDNVGLANYLNEFKTKDSRKGPTEEGLAEVLKSAVKENPNKFAEDLSLFLEVKYRYVYSIFYGLEDAWKEKNNFNWGKVFEFAKKYIAKDNFLEEGQKEQGEDWHSYHIWIISVVADLIQEGTRDDSWAFPEDYFSQAEEIIDILLNLLNKLPKKEEITHKDFVTEALNTSYGRVIIAVILFSLRKARVEDKKGVKKEVRWQPIKYENLLKKEVIEAFTLFGQYMPNFAYLNKPWVEQKIKEFEDFLINNTKWQAFMEGYLYGHRVYKDLYKLMRNHYIKAIENDFAKDRTEDRLIQCVTIGYLRGDESLEGEESLFKKIIDKWNYSQLKEIVDFLWTQSRSIAEQGKETEEDKKIKGRIIQFWAWIYEERDVIRRQLKEDYEKLLSDLSKLTILLDRIDDTNSKWLLLSAPYAGQSFDSTFFLEYLGKIANKENIEFIADIFLEMLSKATPTFQEEHIKSIVEKIYQFGDKDKVNKICNIYGSRGYEFLRPPYEKYNKL